MANWLASADAVVLFTGSTLCDCNEAALKLFACADKNTFLKIAPSGLLLSQQTDCLNAAERMSMLLAQAQQEGVSNGTVIAQRIDGSGFYVNMIVVCESSATSPEKLYCTKWLPAKKYTFEQEVSEVQTSPEQEMDDTGLLQLGRKGDILQATITLCQSLGFEQTELIRAGAKHVLAQERDVLPKMQEAIQKQQAVPAATVALTAKNSFHQSFQAAVQSVSGNNSVRLLQASVPASVSEQEKQLQDVEQLKQENRSLKRMQRLLRKSMERMRVLAEYSPDVIMQFDRKHRHLFVNSQIESLVSYKVEDFLGKTHEQIGFPLSFSTTCHATLEAVFTTGKQQRLELELPNGRWIDWYLLPEFNPAGEVVTIVTTARDITDQKKTAIELQKSQQQVKDAFEVTNLCSWEFLPATDRIVLNDELRDLLGIKESQNSLQASSFISDFVLAEDHGKIRYLIRTAAEATHENFKEVIDYRMRRCDGGIIHVLSSVRLEVNAQGEIVRAFGTSQDITQLRLTEQELEEYRTGLERLVETRTQELRKSEEKLADALRLANLGTWEFDPVAECFLVSDNVLEIFGTTREIEGGNMIPVSRMRESICFEDRLQYLKAVERAQKSNDDFYTDRLELRVRRTDGEIRHLYVSIKIGKTRNFIKYYGTLQDISTIRITEHEKDRLTAIIETTSDIVGIAGLEGSILYLNKAGKEFFGIRDEAVLQQKTFSSFQTPKLTKVLSRKELKHADKFGTWSGQNLYLRHDGREVHVSQVIISHKNQEGQVECYSTILRDMSEQKKIEQDLIFKNNELDTFIYRASHDLRGPIATLLGLNQIVNYEIGDAAALRYFEMYNSQIMRLHNITASLIELTKIKDRSCEVSEIDFAEIWSAVKTDIFKLPESSDVLLHQNIEKIADYHSDAHLLKIILYNLVENSIRYRRSETESFVRVEMSLAETSKLLVLKVSDNGMGIDSELQNKIYNMFFRGTERSKGPGLGLYILKNAVEKLGGRITLYSVPYKGTTFKIELPSLARQQ